MARQMRVQGDVVVKITIGPSGTVSKAEVVSGPEILQQSALDAVKRWKFQPANLDGQPTDSQTVVTITFRI
jgi:protein TonB